MCETYYKIKRSTLDTLANGFQAACELTEPLTPEQMIALLPDMYLDLTKTVADVPENAGVSNALARAALWRDIEFTPQADMPSNNVSNIDTMPAGKAVKGIWYSSTRGTEDFIGYAVSLHSLLTAIHNPRSILYTRTYDHYFKYAADQTDDEGNPTPDDKNVYGANCTSYVSWALGMPYLTVTNWLFKLDCFGDENGVTGDGGVCWNSDTQTVDTDALRTELKLCDVLNSSLSTGGVKGCAHAIMVTGIRRNRKREIQSLDISENTFAGAYEPYGCRVTTITWDELVTDYIVGQAYRVYRYKALANTPAFTENLSGTVYSDLCTNRGDRVAIRPDQELALNVVENADSYAGIVLLKNGDYHSHHEGTADWKLIEPNNASYPLTTGKYTAILYGEGDNPETMTEAAATDKNSTRFIVCKTTVSRTEKVGYTSTYVCSAEAVGGVYPIAMQGTLKKHSGYTSQVVDVTKADPEGRPDAGTFAFTVSGVSTDAESGIVHVPFKIVATEADGTETDYGFVIGEIGYDGNPIEKPKLPEDEPDTPAEEYVYKEVKSIAYTGRTQYIDTGVDMSQYNDTKLNYSYKGAVTGLATDGATYLFGALANDASGTGVRSGNAYINGTTISMYLGENSNAKTNALYQSGKVFELTAINVRPTQPSEMELTVDDASIELISTLAGGSIANTANLYLLAGNIRGVAKGKHEGSFYGFTVTDATTKAVIYKATPCVKKRTSDGEIVEVGILDHNGRFTSGDFTVAEE